MIKISDKYTYPVLERLDSPNGRTYVDPTGNSLPSVTTILDFNKDNEGLRKWQNRVGLQNAMQICAEAARLGTALHMNLENYVLTGNLSTGNNLIHKMARRMAQNIIDNGLSKVDLVFGQEVNIYYPALYAGTIDLVAQHEKQLSIIDFKNSIKIKKIEFIEGYFMQGCAYALAHNELFNTKIKRAVIMMSARPKDGVTEFKEFVLDGNDFDTFTDKWLKKVEEYHKAKAKIQTIF